MLSAESSESTGKLETLAKYKRSEYEKLGFTEYQSRRLTEVPGLDVGSVRAIIHRGCSIKLAYRIYRP